MNDRIEEFWRLLKEQCCVNPKTAIRIVILSEEDFGKAAKKFFSNLDLKQNENTKSET